MLPALPCLLALVSATALCRYTVRDVAFVAWSDAPHVCEAPWSASTQVLADALWEGAPLERGESAESARLRAPDGRELALDTTGWAEAPGGALGALVHSSLRAELASACLERLAVAVLFEGSDAAANGRARAEVEAALEQGGALIDAAPKAVGAAPVLRVVSVEERALERVCAFSWGVELEAGAEPELVLVFGLLRRAGPVLAGASIERAGLLAALALLSQSCECGLDPSWMTGPRPPFVWDATWAQQATLALGFDPRSQLVGAEVGSILARSLPEDEARRALPLAERLLGYREEAVEAAPRGARSHSLPQSAQRRASEPPSPWVGVSWVLWGGGLASVAGAVLVLLLRARRGTA